MINNNSSQNETVVSVKFKYFIPKTRIYIQNNKNHETPIAITLKTQKIRCLSFHRNRSPLDCSNGSLRDNCLLFRYGRIAYGYPTCFGRNFRDKGT